MSLINSLGKEDADKEQLKEECRKHYPTKKDGDGDAHDLSGLQASQLIRFCKEMKRGDIVISPSQRTEYLIIGIVNDDSPFEETLAYEGKEYPDYRKRRKVKWIRRVDGLSINPNLFKLFQNPQAISNASQYSNWIDPLLYQFFRKGDAFHYILRVETKEHIKAHLLFGAVGDLFRLAQEFAEQEKVDTDIESIETRINLNSPGEVELWAGVAAIGFLSVIVVCLAGGGFQLNVPLTGVKLNVKTDGLIKRVNEFLNDKTKRKRAEVLTKKLAALHVQTPDQLVKLLNGIEKNKAAKPEKSPKK